MRRSFPLYGAQHACYPDRPAVEEPGSGAAAGLYLASLPDDLIGLVLTAIDQPLAAGRMLATCRRVRTLVSMPRELGPSAPVAVQVEVLSGVRSPAPFAEATASSGGLELAATHGWVQLLPGLVGCGGHRTHEATRQAALNNRPQVLEWGHVHFPMC